MRRITILDTTLRDGEQAPGCSMKLDEKLEIARQLERLGVDVIEAGFPIASPDDAAAVGAIAEAVEGCGVSALCRAVEGDIACAWEALKVARRPRIHIFLATSDIHLEHKLRLTREQLLERAVGAVRYARSLCPDVEFSAEDATRSHPAFLLEVLGAAAEAGATVLNLCDTVGYNSPEEMAALVRAMKAGLAAHRPLPLGVHCHNDLGMATANTLAAIAAGADHAECTLCGIGERAGMAALEEVAMALATRQDLYGVETGIQTGQLYRGCKLLANTIGLEVPPHKAIVGANAFAHEAGVHQHGVMSNPLTYEIMKPADVGLVVNRMVLGKHSGKAALKERLGEMGYALEGQPLEDFFQRFKRLADTRRDLTDADLEQLIEGSVREVQRYTLRSFVINSGTDITATAVVRLLHDGVEYEHVARGETPVIAAFQAVDKIVKHSYPLHHWSIHSISEGRTELGESVVQILAGDRLVTGRGMHTDIVEACIKAYLSAINQLEAGHKRQFEAGHRPSLKLDTDASLSEP